MSRKLDDALAAEVAAAVRRVLGIAPGEGPPVEIRMEEPRERSHGDRATGSLLAVARSVRRPPRELAEHVVESLPARNELWTKIAVAGPGFINFFLADGWLHDSVRCALAEGEGYGRTLAAKPERVLVEFVSANPTGPLNVVSARSAALGDALARVLAAAGHSIEREFYVNDTGTQVRLLGESVAARIREILGLPFALPEGGYPGTYVSAAARSLLEESGGADAVRARLDDPAWVSELGRRAAELFRAGAQADLERYGVRFDRWYAERALHAEGRVEAVVGGLLAGGGAESREGAVWLKSAAHGDDKDRVLVRQTGESTYLAADLAYHGDKFGRGYDRAIDLWGPDHHGYVARMKAGVALMGFDASRLEILLVQQVNLLRGREKVSMSKRAGDYVTLADLLDEVGRDAARFFFLLRSAEAHLDFDLDLARRQASENPVYYAQYAHARIAGILRKASAEAAPPPEAGLLHLGLLSAEPERALLRRVEKLPALVAVCAALRQPHLLTSYCLDLAREFHAFYAEHRVVDASDGPRTSARLALCEAVRTSLSNALSLLGVSAPASM